MFRMPRRNKWQRHGAAAMLPSALASPDRFRCVPNPLRSVAHAMPIDATALPSSPIPRPCQAYAIPPPLRRHANATPPLASPVLSGASTSHSPRRATPCQSIPMPCPSNAMLLVAGASQRSSLPALSIAIPVLCLSHAPLPTAKAPQIHCTSCTYPTPGFPVAHHFRCFPLAGLTPAHPVSASRIPRP